MRWGPDPRGNCVPTMRELCSAAVREGPLMLGIHHWSQGALEPVNNTQLPQDVAAFLIVRGPHAFLGYPFVKAYRWPDISDPLLHLDVGEPADNCTEAPASVFSRTWTRGRPTGTPRRWKPPRATPQTSSPRPSATSTTSARR